MKQPINDLLTVDIFGSCISRDVLEFCNTEEVSVGQYVARSSFVSSVAPRPDVILAEDEINL